MGVDMELYRKQTRANGSFRGNVPHVTNKGEYLNPETLYVKVAGIWKLKNNNFVSYFYATQNGSKGKTNYVSSFIIENPKTTKDIDYSIFC